MFSVGEIVVLVYCIDPKHNGHVGMECEIVGGLAERIGNISGKVMCYEIKNPSGKITLVKPDQIRKKPPYDGNVKTSWDDLIVWKPKEVVTV